MSVDDLLAIQRSSYEVATSGFREGWPDEQALGRGEIVAFLDRNRYCVLATSRADGRAHAAPVAFVVYGGAFWFASVAGLRLRNLTEGLWASLVVMEGDADVGEVRKHHIALTARCTRGHASCDGPVALVRNRMACPAYRSPRPGLPP